MIVNCAQSCNTCDQRDATKRCTRANLNISDVPSYYPGDMEAMFSSIMESFGDRYEINVLSTSPWVIMFDNFLTDTEIDAMITTQTSWERSTENTGSTNQFGEGGRKISQSRTSSNSWCNNACWHHPDVSSVLAKVEEVVRIPRDNYETFQVLDYAVGQYYKVHHDWSKATPYQPAGPRVLTMFFYLSDVEEGGETAFPTLDIAVRPKKGRALLWPSTLDSDPYDVDPRTRHEAKPVLAGSKFASNLWIHMHEWRKANLWGCTGVFSY